MFRLMLHRMKWEDDVIKTKDESEPKSNNKCSLVWEVIKKLFKIIIKLLSNIGQIFFYISLPKDFS